MSDTISRQAAIDFIDAGHLCNPNEPRWSDNEIVNFLKSRPSAQPERKTGRWEYVDYGGFGNWHCTACRKICICNGDYDFCPNCGADMRTPTQVQLDEADDVMMGGKNGETD